MSSLPRLPNTSPIFKAFLSFVALIITLLPGPFSIHSHADELPREYVLKAGFIYNFTKFIKWPERVDDSMRAKGVTLCVAGKDPFGGVLDRLSESLEEKGKRLTIRRLPTLDGVQSCQILFIGPLAESRFEQLLQAVKLKPILLIGETPGYAQKGIMVNFYIDANKVKFEINKKALDRHGFRASSELLKLARIIEGND